MRPTLHSIAHQPNSVYWFVRPKGHADLKGPMSLEFVHQVTIAPLVASNSSDALGVLFAPWAASSRSSAVPLLCVQQEAAGKLLCFLCTLLLPLISS